MWYSSCCSYKYKPVDNSVGHTRWEKKQEWTPTIGTYPLSSVKQIFHNRQPSCNGVLKLYEVMISTSTLGNLGLIAFLYVANFYQGNRDRKCKSWNIASTRIYILRMQGLLWCSIAKLKSSLLSENLVFNQLSLSISQDRKQKT